MIALHIIDLHGLCSQIYSAFVVIIILDEYGDVERYLKSLSTVPRFSMITMFMSSNCKSG